MALFSPQNDVHRNEGDAGLKSLNETGVLAIRLMGSKAANYCSLGTLISSTLAVFNAQRISSPNVQDHGKNSIKQ